MRLRGSLPGRLCLGASLCCVVLAAHAGATLYKWVDDSGVTHYSDRPAPGAERVKVLSAQGYRSPAAASTSRPRSVEPQPSVAGYARVEVASPQDGDVLSNTGSTVNVSAAVEPRLADGHQLWFILDGTRQTEPAGGSLTATLEVTRGTHTLAVAITDANGREMIASAPISFSVRQTSIANPPKGPALPKPRKKP